MRKKVKRKVRESIPKHIAQAQTFAPLYKILTDIEEGELTEVEDSNGAFVVLKLTKNFNQFKDTFFPAQKYLLYWCKVWDAIAQESNETLSTNALKELALALDSNDVFYEKLLIDAKLELKEQSRLWVKLPSHVINNALKSVSIDDISDEVNYV